AGLAEVAEFGVAQAAGGAAVIHGVAAVALRVGRLDDDVPAQVGDLAAEIAAAAVVVFKRLVQRDGQAVKCGDRPLFRERFVLGVLVNAGGGEDDLVPHAPAGDGLGEGDGLGADGGVLAELDPGAAQGGAVQIEPAAA